MAKIENSQTCDDFQKAYQDCKENDDADDDECADEANNGVNAMEQKEIQESATELESLSSLDMQDTQAWVKLTITLLAEMISGGIRLFYFQAYSSVSAWMHFGVGVFMIIYFVIYLIGYDSWKDGALKKRESLMTSYADTMTQTTLITDSNALKDQKAIIQDQINALKGMEDIYYFHAWAAAISSIVFAAASIIAIVEIFQCIFFGTGCTEYKNPEQIRPLYYALMNKFISLFTPPSVANTDITDQNGETLNIEKDDSAINIKSTSGKLGDHSYGQWFSISASLIIQIFFGRLVTKVIMNKVSQKIAASYGTKIVAGLRVAAYILSSITVIQISLKFDDVSKEYGKRKDLLIKLKDALVITQVDLPDSKTSSTDKARLEAKTTSDGRNFQVNDNNQLDFFTGNCAVGDAQTASVQADPGCQSGQQLKLNIPDMKPVNVSSSGFSTGGISTDPNELFEDIQNFSNGKGMSSMRNSSPNNAAVVQKVIGRLLKKLRTDPKFKDLGGGLNIDQALQQVKKQRQDQMNEIIASIPPNELAALTKSNPLDSLSKPNEDDSFQKTLAKKKEDNLQPKKEKKEEEKLNLVSFGEGAENDKKEIINSQDILKNVEFKQNDIVDKPGVSIWQVLNVRYQKSAWRTLMKKKETTKKAP